MGDNLPFQSKCTALHKAAKKGDAEIVAVLLGRVTNDPSRKWPNVPGPVEGEDSTRFLFAADVNIVDVSQSYILTLCTYIA